MKHIILADIHGEQNALKKSLYHAGFLKDPEDIETLHPQDDTTLTFLGDYIDRGRSSLGILDTLNIIREKIGATMLVGNHELHMLLAVTQPSDLRHLDDWKSAGGRTTYGEFIARYALDTRSDSDRLRYIQHLLLQTRGEYTELFSHMQVAHKIGNLLMTHASMVGAKTWNELNDLYQSCFETQDFTVLMGIDEATELRVPLTAVFADTRRKVGGELMKPALVAQLRKEGMYAFMHGHDVLENGIVQCHNCHGMADINMDVCLCTEHRAYNGIEWGYALYDDKSGNISAHTSKEPARLLGTVTGNGFIFS